MLAQGETTHIVADLQMKPLGPPGEVYDGVSGRAREAGKAACDEGVSVQTATGAWRTRRRTGPTESEQAVAVEDLAYLQSLNAQGVIILAGWSLSVY